MECEPTLDRKAVGSPGAKGYGTAPDCEAHSVSEIIDARGWRPYHSFVVALGVAISMFPGMVIASLPFVVNQIRRELNVTHAAVASAAGFVLFGSIVGVAGAGFLADLVGRRPTLLGALLCGAVASGLHPTIVFFWQLLLVRLFLGVSFGGVIAVLGPYLLEFVPSSSRGWCLSIANLGWNFGTVMGIAVTRAVDAHHWRWVLALPMAPALFTAGLFAAFGPESPRWLVSVGRQAEAALVLARITRSQDPTTTQICARGNSPLPRLADPRAPGLNPAEPGAEEKKAPNDTAPGMWAACRNISQLCLPNTRWVISLAMFNWVLITGGSYSAMFWMPEIIQTLLHAGSLPHAMFIMGEIMSAILAFVTAYTLDRLDRRVALSGSCMVLAALTFSLWLLPAQYFLLLLVILSTQVPIAMMWGAHCAWSNEVFATEQRTTAYGLCNCAGRISGALMPMLIGRVLELSLPMALAMVAGCYGCAGVAGLFISNTAGKPMRDMA